jgi:hypothetical protein
LLDDDFFIGVSNGFAKILNGIDGFIDGMGGLRTVLPLVATLLTKIYSTNIATAIDNMTFNVIKNT